MLTGQYLCVLNFLQKIEKLILLEICYSTFYEYFICGKRSQILPIKLLKNYIVAKRQFKKQSNTKILISEIVTSGVYVC